jgi:inositol hexakisphosphate/diphosphoinositol-pentakisphosphate kinase
MNISLRSDGYKYHWDHWLKVLIREGTEAPPDFVSPANTSEPFIVWGNLVELMKLHRKAMLSNFSRLLSHAAISSTTTTSSLDLASSIQKRWCSGEDADMFRDRWEHIFTTFCDSAEIHPSKIIELYDNLKFDAIHNRQFLEWCFTIHPSLLEGDDARFDGRDGNMVHAGRPFRLDNLNKQYRLCKVLFDYICPQRYSITNEEKLEIGLLSSLPLLQEIVRDIEEMQASDSAKSFFYFTKRSHIYTLLNCLVEGALRPKIPQHEMAELDSLSSICFELYENEMGSFNYSIKITMGRGCYTYGPLNM